MTLGEFQRRTIGTLRIVRANGWASEGVVAYDNEQPGRLTGPKSWIGDNGDIAYPIPGGSISEGRGVESADDVNGELDPAEFMDQRGLDRLYLGKLGFEWDEADAATPKRVDGVGGSR